MTELSTPGASWKPDTVRAGMVIGGRQQARGMTEVLAAVRCAATSGLRSVWTVEARGMEAFSLLGALTGVADLDLGTAITPAPFRPPTLAAMGAATVQALAGQRTVWLGIGASTPLIAGTWHSATYGPHPLDRLEEYVTVLRRALSGERVDFHGQYYTVSGFRLEPALLGAQQPRIALAALGRRALELGGRVADAVILNAIPVSSAAHAATWARELGNDVGFCFVHAAVGDPGVGRDLARRGLSGEIMSDAYARHLTRLGYQTVVGQVRDLQAKGDRPGALAAIPDEMCDDLYCAGSAEDVSHFMAAYRDAGLVPILMPEVGAERPFSELEATIAAAGI